MRAAAVVHCSQCGSDWRDPDARYCGRCGASLAAGTSVSTRAGSAAASRRSPLLIVVVSTVALIGLVAAGMRVVGSRPARIADPELTLPTDEPIQRASVTPRGIRCAIGDLEIGCTTWMASVDRDILPVVADGVIVAAMADGRVVGLDAVDGTERWGPVPDDPDTTLRPKRPEYLAALGGGLVEVVDETGSAIVRASTGEVLLGGFGAFFYVSPVVDGVVTIGQLPVRPDGSAMIRVMDARTWTELSSFQRARAPWISATFDGRLVLEDGDDIVIHAFDGTELARRTLPRPSPSHPREPELPDVWRTIDALDGALLIRDFDGDVSHLTRLDPRTLDTVWSRTAPAWFETIDGVLVAVGLDDQPLSLIDLSTGEARWSVDGAPWGPGTQRYGDVLLLASWGMSTQVQALDLTTGEQRWAARAPAGGPLPDFLGAPDGLWAYSGYEILRYDATGRLPGWELTNATSGSGVVLSSDPLVIKIGSRVFGFDRAEIEQHLPAEASR